MNAGVFQDLIAAAARRPLTADEQARLAAYCEVHPEARAAWEEEARLSEFLKQLPPAPVSSNFTSRVVRSARRHAARHHRPSVFDWWKRLIPRGYAWQAGLASLLLLVGVLARQQHLTRLRTEVAQSVGTVSALAALPSFELLQDFDPIERLPSTPFQDEDALLAALE